MNEDHRLGTTSDTRNNVDHRRGILYSVLFGSSIALVLATICEACGLYTWIAQIIWEVTR